MRHSKGLDRQFRAIKGTRDILPPETDRWRAVEKTIHEFMSRWGYKEIRTPVFERTELFARSIGEGSDLVTKQMYSLLDQGQTSLTLKPELTAPVIRAYIQHNLAKTGKLTKLYYVDSLFRQERPQKGRLRQFHQFGVEAIGSPHPEQDAEVIALAFKLLQALGIEDLTLHLNSIGSPSSRANYRRVLVGYLSQHIDKLSETNRRRLRTNPLRILDSKSPEEQTILYQTPHILDYLDPEDLDHYEAVKNCLADLEIPFVQNHTLVRGLDYYSRTTFEISSRSLGAQDALCGGGRYDDLVEELGGTPTPAVGFAAGIERILLLLEGHQTSKRARASGIYVVAATENAREDVFKLTYGLRDAGFAAEFDTVRRSLKGQMREANRLNCAYAIIIGEEELTTGVAQVKELTSGEQTPVVLDKLTKYFSS